MAALTHIAVWDMFKPDAAGRTGRRLVSSKIMTQRVHTSLLFTFRSSNVLHLVECSAPNTFLPGRLILLIFNVPRLKKKYSRWEADLDKNNSNQNSKMTSAAVLPLPLLGLLVQSGELGRDLSFFMNDKLPIRDSKMKRGMFWLQASFSLC